MTARTITTFDSLPKHTSFYYSRMMERLVDNLVNVGVECSQFSMKKELQCSRQTNSYNCGIIALLFLNCRLNELPLDSISPRSASKYRLECARFFIGTTDHGTNMLNSSHGDLSAVLKHSLHS